jgi:signal transduction histidine kinase
MSGLRPDVLDIVGLVDAISLYVQNFQNKYKIFCLIESNVTTLSLQSEQTIALYRIVQEAFANIARHAQASTVRLKMEVRDGSFCMTIEDDGVGFDEASIKRHSSFGMLGMQERAHLLDGKLKIQSTPGSGTKVTIEMSYNK